MLAAGAALSGCAAPDHSASLQALEEEGRQRMAPALDLEVETVATELPPQPGAYRIGVHDVLDVQVPGNPEFGARVQAGEPRVIGFRVKTDGRIYVPHVGGVPAAGRTALEVQADLGERLGAYLDRPQVSVDVLRYESQRFYVLGEVEKPGSFAVDGHVTLLEAIGLAEGIGEEGDLATAYVVRGRTLLPISLAALLLRGDTSRNIVMQDHDLVFVPRASEALVYVLGDVRQPGSVPVPPAGLSLAAALGAAEGLDLQFSDKDEIRVFRGSWQEPRVFTLSAAEIYRHGSHIMLRRGDVIHVAPRGVATWYRTVTLLLPFLNGVTAAAALR